MHTNVLISRVLTVPQVYHVKQRFNQGTISRQPIGVEAHRQDTRVIVRRVRMVLTIERQVVNSVHSEVLTTNVQGVAKLHRRATNLVNTNPRK